MGTFRHSLEKQVFLPPYLIKDPSIFVFMLEGDAKTIQDKIVDPVLSEPGKSDFELLFDGKFLIQFIRQQHLSSLSTLERDAGFFRYHETIVYLVRTEHVSGFISSGGGGKGDIRDSKRNGSDIHARNSDAAAGSL